jgi:hypothetical protein
MLPLSKRGGVEPSASVVGWVSMALMILWCLFPCCIVSKVPKPIVLCLTCLGVAGVYIGRGSDGVVVAALGYLFSGSQPSHYEEIPLFAALTPASALPVVPY